MKNILLLSTVCLTLLANPTDSLAKKDGDGHHSKEKHGHHHEEKDHNRYVIRDHDRTIIRKYYVEHYGNGCPPGLAKKHNGCLPPGIAKKRYAIGRPLIVDWQPLPDEVLVRLEPVPYGYQYVRVDNDVLLIAEGSKKIIDAFTLFSAVGN